ncbi:hypothetical protein AB0M31_14425 [Streptomyces sp. NPDC051773]|uniref:hypothetical protein n=1 Tax=Streptomyces sp. NPDC051773 TaxID=3156682 RepID=UPI00342F2929
MTAPEAPGEPPRQQPAVAVRWARAGPPKTHRTGNRSVLGTHLGLRVVAIVAKDDEKLVRCFGAETVVPSGAHGAEEPAPCCAFTVADSSLKDEIDAAYRNEYANSPYLPPMLPAGPQAATVSGGRTRIAMTCATPRIGRADVLGRSCVRHRPPTT